MSATRLLALVRQWWHCLVHLHGSLTMYDHTSGRVIARGCSCGAVLFVEWRAGESVKEQAS